MNRISNSIPAAASRKPALDFIRIVFCLMVVCEHYLVPAPPSGAIAVIGFCVMSGFWIGPLLERKELDVVSFYRGKARRLLPLLGLALLSGFVLAVVFSYHVRNMAHWNVFSHTDFSILKIMYFYDVPAWYMNCELMFLLLVPFFYALCRANILWYAAVLAFLFLTAFALYSHVPEGIPRGGGLYYSPLARMWQFMAGVLAYRMIRWKVLAGAFPVLFLVFLVGSAISVCLSQQELHYYEDSFPFQVMAALFYMALLPSAYFFSFREGNRMFRVEKWLAYGSSLTYGIFLFHVPVLNACYMGLLYLGVISREQTRSWAVLLLSFSATIVLVGVLMWVVKEGKKGFRECLFISICGIKAVFQIFRGKGCILQEALKTAFFPVFRQLVAVAGSGVISSVKAVDASFTKLIEEDSSGNTILCRRGSLDGA